MRFNPFKNIRLSFQLYSLVAVSLLIWSEKNSVMPTNTKKPKALNPFSLKTI